MLPSLEGEQWSVEWPMLEKWPWPNLEVLVKTFGASTWTQNKSCDDECFFCICTAVRYYKLLWFSPICSKIVDDLLVVGNEDEGHSSWLFLAIYGSRCFLQWFRAGWSRTSCMLDVLREILSCCSRRLLTTKGICTTLWCGFSKGHLHMFEHLDDQHCDWPADLFAGCTQICALYRPDFIF